MKTKGLIRSLNRRGVRSDRTPPVGRKAQPAEGTVCERCGAVFSRRTWRRRPLTHARLASAVWAVCPGCAQAAEGQYFGRVLVRGRWPLAHEDAVRRRIANVAARAGVTQPERRLVSIARGRQGLEVLTTSQKLAHRIVHELKKAFRGRAVYTWSHGDGSLLAVWQRDDAAA
jgi:NMD protein affecting ribosome stability and mRNA decay